MPRCRKQGSWLRAVVPWMAVGMLASTACSGGGGTQAAAGQNSTTATVSQREQLAPPQSYGGGYRRGTATGDTEQGASFARWVLDQDPGAQYITDAVVRGEQSLGVKVQSTASKADVQQLLTALTQGMARTFPSQPVDVVAFYQSGDKLAESVYDPRSGQVNVQFTR
jgi:hypothetical protein